MDLRFNDDYDRFDRAAIAHGMHRWYDAVTSGSKRWTKHIDLHKTVDSVLGGEVRSVLVNGFLVVYDVVETWYGAKVLAEMLVLRIENRPGSFFGVLRFLETMAKANECHGITVGTALTLDDRLLRVYERAGFQIEAQSMYKESAWATS